MKLLLIILICYLELPTLQAAGGCKIGGRTNDMSLYNVGDSKVKKMYCDISKITYKDATEARKKLAAEAIADKRSLYYNQFQYVIKLTLSCPPILFEAECIAIRMYTTCFYEQYNEEYRSGNLKKFKVFTALLHNAIMKMSKTVKNMVVYRGVRQKFPNPSKPFYYKQFTSTSANVAQAAHYSEGQKLHKYTIEPFSLVAFIAQLSEYPHEAEILISPFQPLQFIGEDAKYINFKTVLRENFRC